MPNWVHNLLTVSGEEKQVAAFVEKARPSTAYLLRVYEELKEQDYRITDDDLPPYDEWEAAYVAEHPLTFASHVPQPSAVELLAIEERAECHYCEGTGRRPRDEVAVFVGVLVGGGADADAAIDAWYQVTGGCNACHGAGQRVREPGWLAWNCARGGTKWDAVFGGGRMALGAESMDLAASVEANSLYRVDGTAVYRFDTPWSPPLPWLDAVAGEHPELRIDFRFGDAGNGEAGILLYADGALVERREVALDEVLSSEQMWF
jgi:hypothetical protein